MRDEYECRTEDRMHPDLLLEDEAFRVLDAHSQGSSLETTDEHKGR